MNRLQADVENINEQDLVERLKKGQQWAFNTLVDRYQNMLLKISYGMTLNYEDSIEIVQDVFVIVFKKIDTFREDSSLATWLRKITLNQCLNWKRKWKRRFKWHHYSLDLDKDKSMLNNNTLDKETMKKYDPEMLYREKQLGENLKRAVKKLPEKIRVVFVLNSLEGLSYEQIAKTLNIKKGTVSSRLYFARKNLMKSLAANE